jgi:class 3 adenylate cyclase
VKRPILCVLLALLVGLSAAPGKIGMVAAGFLVCAGGALFLRAALWTLFHPRAVAPARGVASRWALWLGLYGLVQVAVPGTTSLVETIGFVAAAAFFLLLALPIAFGVAFLVMLPLGFVGAGLGVLAARRCPDESLAARAGATALSIAAVPGLVFLLLPNLDSSIPETWRRVEFALLASAPILATWLAPRWAIAGSEPQRAVQRVMKALSRRLVPRWESRNRQRTLDLRGATLGLVAGVLALVVGATTISAQAGAWVLAGMIQVRNRPAGSRVRRHSPRGMVPWSAAAQRIILAEMDMPARREALTTRSESAIQAELVGLLGKWGATRVVVPLPALGVPQISDGKFARLHGGWYVPQELPVPSQSDIGRSIRDLPVLERAVRAAGNVLLLDYSWTPDVPVPAIERLSRAALEVGSPDLAQFGLPQLPCIATPGDNGRDVGLGPRPSSPILLLAAARGRRPVTERLPGQADRVQIAGEVVPEIETGKVLVNFMDPPPGRGFPRISYSSLMRGESQYETGAAEEHGSWRSPEDFFKGKIVFLDSLAQRASPVDTAVGPMLQTEVLANATTTLLSGVCVRRFDPLLGLLLTLAAGILVGHLCLRRNPLQASAILAGSLAGLAVYSGWLFVSRGIWMDLAVPFAAAAGSCFLVTGFTYSLERRDRETNRALLRRFVAPQVVEELMDDIDTLGLGGTRQKVCVLFADVRDFGGFAEQHTPEEVVETINAYMMAATEVLLDHGGILDKYTGDGLMALFRISTTEEEGVTRAVRGALAIQGSARSVSDRLVEEGRQPLRMGIGLHYGEAVVGLVGSDMQSNYTALGHAVVVSARLQSIAAGGEVMISESVYLTTFGAFRTEEGEPVRVKGISQPIRPYRVLGD